MGNTVEEFPLCVKEKGHNICGITLDWSSEVLQERIRLQAVAVRIWN